MRAPVRCSLRAATRASAARRWLRFVDSDVHDTVYRLQDQRCHREPANSITIDRWFVKRTHCIHRWIYCNFFQLVLVCWGIYSEKTIGLVQSEKRRCVGNHPWDHPWDKGFGSVMKPTGGHRHGYQQLGFAVSILQTQ